MSNETDSNYIYTTGKDVACVAESAHNKLASWCVLGVGIAFLLIYCISLNFKDLPWLELISAFLLGQLLIQIPLRVSVQVVHQALAVAGLLVLIILASYLGVDWCGYAMLACGSIVLGWLMLRQRTRLTRDCKAVGIALSVILCLSFLLGAYIASTGYHSPFFYKKVLTATAHVDTLFHISISNMLKIFSTVTTGLDGIAATKYHVGSHYFFSRLGILFNSSGMAVYNIYYPLVILPLFIGTLLIFCSRFQQVLIGKGNLTILSLGFLLILLFPAPLAIMATLMATPTASLMSESFILSLGLCFLFSTFLIEALQLAVNEYTAKRAGLFVMLCITSFAVTFCKVSVGFYLCCLVGVLGLLFFKKLKLDSIFALVICLAGNAFIAIVTSASGYSSFRLLAFFRDSINQWLLAHIIIHHLPLLCLVALLWFKHRTFASLKKNKVDFYVLLISIATTGLNLLPTLFLDLYSSAYYFSVTPVMLIPVSMAYAVQIKQQYNAAFIFNRHNYFHVAAVLFAGVLVLFISRSFYKPLKDERKNVREIYTSQELSAEFATRKRITEELIRLSKETLQHKHETLIYIPPYVEAFWKSDAYKWSPAFLIPALSEHAAIDSIMPKSLPLGQNIYSIGSYPESKIWKYSGATDSELIEKAHQLGFKRVIVIDEAGSRVVE